MTWPLHGSKARGDLVFIQTPLLLLCKSSCSNANQFTFTWQKQRGLYHGKATSSLTFIPGPGHWAHNCKMGMLFMVGHLYSLTAVCFYLLLFASGYHLNTVSNLQLAFIYYCLLTVSIYLLLNRGGKFLKKLWCYVGGEYNKIIWFYQLGW